MSKEKKSSSTDDNGQLIHTHYFLTNRIFLIVMLTIISILILDVIITKISVFMSQELMSIWRNIVFAMMAGIFIVGQYFIMEYVKSRMSKFGKRAASMDIFHKATTIAQYGLAIIFLITIFQIITESKYSTSLLTLAIGISYTLAVFNLTLLAVHFFSWYRSNRNLVVLLYGISAASLSFNAGLTLALSALLLQDKPELVLPRVGVLLPLFEPGSLKAILNSSVIISSVISFLITWIATSSLLHHHSRRLGKFKYWIIVAIPLVYFLTQFLNPLLGLFDPIIELSPVINSILLILIFALSKPVGGILFGVAFWSIARNVQSNVVKDYMKIAAFGLALLFISNQAISTVNTPSYPPFGLVTVSFMGLASYLIFIGIYYSAISVSQDVKLRTKIRRFAADELRLLHNIGSAELRVRLENEVKHIIMKNQATMLEETGIPPSLDEEDAKQYLNEILRELGKQKNNKTSPP
jgi:hypothetical protein